MPDVSSPRVLLVDDDPAMLRLLEVNFRLDGFVVETATRGEEALERATASPPDAILLDVMMPGMDGYEVCRRMREIADLQAVPVVFLTARTQDEDRDRSRNLGVIEHVSKPFDPSEVVTTVRRLVGRGATG